jgi:transcriptional regulator with XRE-family HTH domain
MSAESHLRAQVRAALATANLSQAEASRRLGLSTKYMSHMLTGRAPLTLPWAEKLLALCGMRISIGISLNTEEPTR